MSTCKKPPKGYFGITLRNVSNFDKLYLLETSTHTNSEHYHETGPSLYTQKHTNSQEVHLQ